MRSVAVTLATLLGLPAAAAAQGDCFPGSNSNEARTLRAVSVHLRSSCSTTYRTRSALDLRPIFSSNRAR